jgi:hypothetical protein
MTRRSSYRLGVVARTFELSSAAQQILDRFLIGHSRDAEFTRSGAVDVQLHVAGESAPNEHVKRRVDELGLVHAPSIEDIVRGSDALIVVSEAEDPVGGGLNSMIVGMAGAGSSVFVHGALGAETASARTLAELARSRAVRLGSASWPSTTWRLPDVDVPKGARIRRALVVTHGSTISSDYLGFEALLSRIEHRVGGEAGVRGITAFDASNVWSDPRCVETFSRLLEAAVSRSDSPQGDPVADGRTQDIVGLGLVPGLAPSARLYRLDHSDGLTSGLLVIDGAIADTSFAFEMEDGVIRAAQFYRGPRPVEAHWSSLVAQIDTWFAFGEGFWGVDRSVLIAGILAASTKSRDRPGEFLATPELASPTKDR